ncbi:MAG: tetratricopeptide repeat protein [Planctomycetota bacterium]
MRMFQTALMAGIIATSFAGSLLADPAEDLFAKTHEGAKESKVASEWYDALPEWVSSQTSKNQFPETHLPYIVEKPNDDGLGKAKYSKDVNKFQIRDANKREFSAYMMVRNGVDAVGRPTYDQTNTFIWLSWKSWPAKYILETYPIGAGTKDAELVAMGAWLYGEKENELANRVLTQVHERNDELKPLVAAYICDKEKWDLPADGMKLWNVWDIEYQKERQILVTPDEYEKRLKEREKAASDRFKELLRARGDYKGRPPRRNQPTMQLVLVEWEIKQFKIKFGSSDFLKDTKNSDKLQEILDSIKDDLAVIQDNLEEARKKVTDNGNPNQLKEKAEYMEGILTIDPEDMNLRSQVANAWYAWGNPAPHGNGCDRAEGIKKAIPHYERILEVFPNNTSFLLAMGRCYQALEDSKHARGYYEKVIELDGTKGSGPTAKALIRNMDQNDANRANKGK